ncbi:hypothetical protein BH24ACT26_BH24ACT26_22860 [soil metagenome]
MQRAACGRVLGDLALARSDASAPGSVADLERLTSLKRNLAELVRALQGRAAWLITGSDWQSPSFGHSMHSAAGRHTGKVTEHVDDYKRDRHPDARLFERAFLREYVDTDAGRCAEALMTSCGMAAFSTILGTLCLEWRTTGRVLIGRCLYHECKDLLRRALGARVREIDETDTCAMLRAITQLRPGAVFLDSLCNAREVHVPDLRRIIEHLERHVDEDLYLVIDNTGLSASCQPMAMLSGTNPALHLVVFESLTKFAQLGLDRVTAGMIIASPQDAAVLGRYREHFGTNVSDVSPYVIPEPSRAVLERRLQRVDRNALLLARRLRRAIGDRGAPWARVNHPALPEHPSYSVARRLPFRGGFLTLELERSWDHTGPQRAFVEAALEEAASRRVPLIAGASFGLDTTRVYSTSSGGDGADAFLRVAAGTEHRLGIEGVADVLEAAVRRLGT